MWNFQHCVLCEINLFSVLHLATGSVCQVPSNLRTPPWNHPGSNVLHLCLLNPIWMWSFREKKGPPQFSWMDSSIIVLDERYIYLLMSLLYDVCLMCVVFVRATQYLSSQENPSWTFLRKNSDLQDSNKKASLTTLKPETTNFSVSCSYVVYGLWVLVEIGLFFLLMVTATATMCSCRNIPPGPG